MWMLLHPLVWSNTAIVSSLGPSQLLSPVGWVPLYLSSALSGRQLRPVRPLAKISAHITFTSNTPTIRDCHTLYTGTSQGRPGSANMFLFLKMFEQTLPLEGEERAGGERGGSAVLPVVFWSVRHILLALPSPPPSSLLSLLSLLSPRLYCPATNKIIKNIRRIRIEYLEKIWEKSGIISFALWSNMPELAPLFSGDLTWGLYIMFYLLSWHHIGHYILSTAIKYRTAHISRNFPDRLIKSCLT